MLKNQGLLQCYIDYIRVVHDIERVLLHTGLKATTWVCDFKKQKCNKDKGKNKSLHTGD